MRSITNLVYTFFISGGVLLTSCTAWATSQSDSYGRLFELSKEIQASKLNLKQHHPLLQGKGLFLNSNDKIWLHKVAAFDSSRELLSAYRINWDQGHIAFVLVYRSGGAPQADLLLFDSRSKEFLTSQNVYSETRSGNMSMLTESIVEDVNKDGKPDIIFRETDRVEGASQGPDVGYSVFTWTGQHFDELPAYGVQDKFL